MSVATVLLPFSSIAFAAALLLLTPWLERSVLSPRSLITLTIKIRNTPEHAEQAVADQAAHLLGRT